jgi:hypothetical protein
MRILRMQAAIHQTNMTTRKITHNCRKLSVRRDPEKASNTDNQRRKAVASALNKTEAMKAVESYFIKPTS